jgi:hypothetical protein
MNIIKDNRTITVEFTDEEFKIMSHDLFNPLDWMERMTIEKLANRKSALIEQWTKRLLRDKSVQNIPTDETKLLDLIFNHPQYRNRVEREK